MCTVLLPPGVDPIAVNKYINKDALCVWLNLKELNRSSKFSQTFSRFCLDLTYLHVETPWTNSQIQDDVLELTVNRINAGLKHMCHFL